MTASKSRPAKRTWDSTLSSLLPQQWQYIFDVSFWDSSLRSNCTTYLRSSALLGNDVAVYAFHFYKRDSLYTLFSASKQEDAFVLQALSSFRKS